MLQIRQLCIASVLLFSGVASAASVRLQVEGLSGELEKNVRAQLSTIQSDEVTPDRRFRARVDDAIREGLKALGYYEPTIEFDLRPPPARGRQVLIARVTPGEPVRIGGTDVILRGGAQTDRDYLDLLKTRPAIGTVLNHGDYDGFKSSLTRVALRKGYFDSEFNKSQLGVSLDRHQAFWDIDYNSGERYRFGPVTFEGSQIRDEYLQNLVPFKPGDYYTSQDLAELNRRLAATGWFSSVVVAPQFEKSRQTKVLPLQGVVSPRKEILELAGVNIPNDIQGESLLPLLEGKKPGDWRSSLYYHFYEYPGEHAVKRHYGVRDSRYKLIHFYNDIDVWELYDLKEDPSEMNNLYGKPGTEKITNRLKEELKKLQKQYDDPIESKLAK